MAVVRALLTAGGAVRRNPSVVAVVVVALLVQLPIQFARVLGPRASVVAAGVAAVLTLLATPFVFAGLFGMADEALDGETTLRTFLRAGKRNYVSMLGAYVLFFLGAVAFAFVSTILFGLVAFGVFAPLTSGAVSESTFGVVGPVVLAAFALAWFLPLFFVQFYGQAIVLDDRGAVGGYRRSVGLVRRNLLSVFGYSVLVFAVGAVVGVLSSIPSALLSAQSLGPAAEFPDIPLSVVAAVVVVGDVLVGVVAGLFVVYSVAFYRTLDAGTEGDGAPPAQRTVA